MTFSRTVTGWLLLGLLGGALAQGCGSSSSTRRPSGSGAVAGTAGKDTGSMTVEPPGMSGAGGEGQFDPLCGIAEANSCNPDLDSNSLCTESVGATGGGGSAGRSTAGTGGSSSGTGGSSGRSSGTGGTGGTGPAAGGAGGESGAQNSAEGGAPQGGMGATPGQPATNGGAPGGQSGEGGAGQSTLGGAGAGAEAGMGPSVGAFGGRQGTAGSAAAGRAGGSATSGGVSCQVVENPKHKGSPLAVCRAAGGGTEGSPCFSGADCAPTLACVGDGPGQCRAYCCSGSTECKTHTGTHCAVEPLVLEVKSTRVLQVPVCMPPVKCSLAEPYPCPDGGACSCPSDSACVVVSDDGTTSCLQVSELPPAGQGEEAQPCPCAWGYVCSPATNACLKLCEVAAPDVNCSSGRCQASTALPDGWGTCVGTAPKDAGTP